MLRGGPLRLLLFSILCILAGVLTRGAICPLAEFDDILLPTFNASANGVADELEKKFEFPGLNISAVLHKARIEIDERGTTAAAVTRIDLSMFDHGAMENTQINVFLTNREACEMTAQEFRDGTVKAMTGMKPLRYKRGFLTGFMGL